ncbi:tyrosine-type recombinase/integrase [Chelatococcus asaccharovorans]|nr:tyrosine-type recombinase/integrase [Chelatococcus asaccharovorans]
MRATICREISLPPEMMGRPRPPPIVAAWAKACPKACAKAGITALTFHDFRGSAVTRLALAGASVPEIATITGHTLRDVQEILDAHDLSRDVTMAESAVRKLEEWSKGAETRTDFSKFSQNAVSGPTLKMGKT